MKTTTNNKPLITHHIYLVRHGDVDVAADICYGQLDCAVTQSFDADLLTLTDYFKTKLATDSESGNLKNNLTVQNPLLISSPLTRCLALAEGLLSNLNQEVSKHLQIDIEQGKKVQVKKAQENQSQLNEAQINQSQVNEAELQINKDFQEINFGQWEGLTWQTIGQLPIEEWSNNLLDYAFPNGESAREFHCRVIQAWDRLQQQLSELQQSKTVIIICHAGVVRSILSAFLHIPLQHSLSLKIDKMSVSCLDVIPAQRSLSRCVGINHALIAEAKG